MMEVPHLTKRSSCGFTMMELLGAIAVLVILMAVSFPAIASIKTSLEMTRLDATAKQIYLAAQKKMSSMQSNGTLETFTTNTNNTQQTVSADKAIYPYDNNVSIYYLLSSDDLVKNNLLSEDSAAITRNLPGSWVIELSPSTGEIYSVFYSENTDASTLKDEAYSLTDRNRTTRTPDRIGYYCGGQLQEVGSQQNSDSLDNLSIQIVNSEELYIQIIGNVLPAAYLSSDSFSITISITGKNNSGSTATWTNTYEKSNLIKENSWTPDSTELDIVLDSMKSGESFQEITDNTILPGSNLTVFISISYGNDSKQYTESNINSLFKKYDESSGTVYIGCVRHLNNLRKEINTSTNYNWNRYSTINFTNDIDFIREAGSTWSNNECVSIQSLDTPDRNTGVANNPLSYFKPIVFDGFGTWTSGDTINGLITDATGTTRPCKIRNFIIGNSQSTIDNTGLFGSLSSNPPSIENINLVNTKVYGANDTGALIGSVSGPGLTIKNCSVTVDTSQENTHAAYSNILGANNTGGLIGMISSTSPVALESCTASVNVSGSSNVGGLLGYATNTMVKSSNATEGSGETTTISGSSNVGGLIGYTTNGSIESCTASVNVSGSSNVGGLIGSNGDQNNAGSKIVDSGVRSTSSSYLTVSGSSNVGGLIGYRHSDTITGCYAAAQVMPSNIEDISTSNFGGFIGYDSGWGDISNCYSSGSVKAYKYVGGFEGYSASGNIKNCFTTSDVYADSYVGGFAGFVPQVNQLDSDISYGEVLSYDGSLPSTLINTIHGFVGSFGNTWQLPNNCKYLYANGYNDNFDVTAPYLISGSEYKDLLRSSSSKKATSHPYSTRLEDQQFPFAFVTDSNGNAIDYYGDWPTQLSITWERGNNTQISTEESLYDATPIAPSGIKPSPSQVDYLDENTNTYHLWNGTWSGTGSPITANTTFTAVYTSFAAPQSILSSLWSTITSSISGGKTTAAVTSINSSGNSSWLVYIKADVYASENGDQNGISASDSSNYEGNFVVYAGPKASTAGRTLSIVEYDVGRATKGEPAYRRGTIASVDKGNGSIVYDQSTFKSDGDWFSVSQ